MIPSSQTINILKKSAISLGLSLPVVIWINDKIYTTCKVVGTSMEPALYDGDVLLLRKSDLGLGIQSRLGHYLRKKDDQDKEEQEEEEEEKEEWDKQQILKIDASVGKIPSGWVSSPPLVLRGDVVVYACPHSFPVQWNVKRVIGLGGQRVRPSKEWQRFLSIPSYSIWVEGDNTSSSDDSNKTGPISKKSIVGVAEAIIWPPSRWSWGNNMSGGVERIRPLPGRSWWA
mmetsp:Transcript_3540/g.5341  ORF Transcript_3540/g.5341 Transcript_3540/m.5341 type:complete len:229 (+) Transcript_3540:84-770(+)